MRVVQVGIAAVLFVAAASAQDFMPLESGNFWTYRSADGRETREIRVGTSVITNGFAWYSVTGLAPKPLLVARMPDGSLVSQNPETGEKQTLLQPAGTFKSVCGQSATVSERRVGYQGPLGFFNEALQVTYSVSNCKEAGLEEELYLEDIGLARRTFAGPRTLDLVAARVGRFSFASDPSSITRLALEKSRLDRTAPDEPLKLKAQVQIALVQTQLAKIHFDSEQRYDLIVRDAQHRVVYRWSEGRFFAAKAGEEEIRGERAFSLQVELPANLTDGSYQAEAWLTTADGPQFVTSSGIEVRTVAPALAMMPTRIQKLSADALPLGI